MGRHIAFVGGIRNAYKMFAGKPEVKTPFRRPRYGWG
jgi:hypothetical protein